MSKSHGASNQLVIDVRRYGAEHQAHSHDYHQLVLPLQGLLSIEVDGKGNRVSSNDNLAVIACGQVHGFAAQSDNAFIVADVPIHWLTLLERLPTFVKVTDSISHYIRFVAAQISCGNVSEQIQRQILTLLIDILAAEFSNDKTIDRRLVLAKSYLDENLSKTVSLATVATIACLSSRQLSYLFKRQWGLTVQQYVQQQRMKKALSLLSGSSISVEHVATLVGYQSLAAFSYRFKQYFGYCPSSV